MKYKIKWSEENQTYLVSCSDYPSLVTHGFSPKKAMKELKKVISFIKEIEEGLSDD